MAIKTAEVFQVCDGCGRSMLEDEGVTMAFRGVIHVIACSQECMITLGVKEKESLPRTAAESEMLGHAIAAEREAEFAKNAKAVAERNEKQAELEALRTERRRLSAARSAAIAAAVKSATDPKPVE